MGKKSKRTSKLITKEEKHIIVYEQTIPCKHCGGESECVKGDELSYAWIVRCKNCGQFIEYKNAFYSPENKRQAIAIWNEKNKPDRNTSDLKVARKAKWGL